MNGIKDRLLEFLKYLKIGQSAFEKKVEVANGLINNIGDSLHSKTINKITSKYPKLNTSWLLTGQGEMLLKMENIIENEKYGGIDDLQLSDLEFPEAIVGKETWESRIDSLIDTNKIYANAQLNFSDAQKVFADAHLKALDTNAMLAEMLKSSRENDSEIFQKHQATENAPQQSVLSDPSKFQELLVILAKIGSGETPWQSMEEAIGELSSRFVGQKKEEKATGTRDGAGKSNK